MTTPTVYPLITVARKVGDDRNPPLDVAIRERPPFHVYSHRGDRLLYDVATSSVLAIDDVAYTYLRVIEQHADSSMALREAVEAYGVSRVQAMLSELMALINGGFLRSEPSATDAQARTFRAGLVTHRPRNLMFLVTEACNLKCVYCYEVASQFHDRGRSMSYEHAKRVIDRYINANAGRDELRVTFFGGEPLINMNLIRQVVSYCRLQIDDSGTDLQFSITTNGTMLSEDACEFLVENNFAVMVSFDGPKAQHDRNRIDHSGRGTHHRVEDGIRRLLAKQRARGVNRLCIRATMTRANQDYDGLMEYFRTFGEDVRVMIGVSNGTAFDKSESDVVYGNVEEALGHIDGDISDVIEWARDFTQPSRQLGVVEDVLDLYRLSQSRRPDEPCYPKLCGVGRNMLAVTPSGAAYPCHRYVGMEAWKIGDSSQGTSEPEGVGGYYKKLVDSFNATCVKCWARFACGGQCPWYLSHPDGYFVPPDRSSCDIIRARLERALWLYAYLVAHHKAWLLAVSGENSGDQTTAERS